MKKVAVSAPGKLMLYGEHAVVYGHPCIVTAVDQRMFLKAEKNSSGIFSLNAPDVDVLNYEKKISLIGVGDTPKGAKFVEIALKNVIEKYKIKVNGLKIDTNSDFKSTFGFGSSSASTVCMVKALSELYGLRLSSRQIFDIAFKTVLEIQGKGSGFDVAAAVYGGTLYFVTAGKVIKPLKIKSLPLVIGYSGIKADTVTLIDKVSKKFKKNNKRLEEVYRQMEEIVEDAKDFIVSGNLKEAGELMSTNQKLLKELGVSIKKLDDMISFAVKDGAYGAKLSGAGGGDCMISFGPSDKISQIKKAIERAGGEVLEVGANAKGVRIEKMKATAVAPSNIAFIKYWGKKDEVLRLPENGSISMNLSNLLTTTTVEFSEEFSKDEVIYNGISEPTVGNRAIAHINRIRKLAKVTLPVKVVTKNNFPGGTGLSSSASGFAALTLATTKALGLKLSQKELSILARQGSGSACRSIPDGIVEWLDGDTSDTSYAKTIFPKDHWDIVDVVAVVSTDKKEVSTTEGQKEARGSQFFEVRKREMSKKIKDCKKLLEDKNFEKFGELVEAEALELHSIMLTSHPSLIYLLPETLKIMKLVKNWRQDRLSVYFTLNTGQNIHLITQKKDEMKVIAKLKKLKFVKKIIQNYPSNGARISDEHLF